MSADKTTNIRNTPAKTVNIHQAASGTVKLRSGLSPAAVPAEQSDSGAGNAVAMTNQVVGATSGTIVDSVYVMDQVIVINGQSYKVERHINQARASGEAYVYLVRHGLEPLVLKHYKSDAAMPMDVLTRIKANPHPRIVSIKDFGVIDGRSYELMAYAKGGSLESYIQANGGIKNLVELKHLVDQINQGLEFLHQTVGIIYQDLKPDNVMFTDQDRKDIILADFGISGCLQPGINEAVVVANGSEEFAAPELARKMNQEQVMVSKAVDYFALGVSIYNLWLGKNPFENLAAQQRDYLILQQSLDFPADMDKELLLLLKGLLHPLAKDRWGSEQVRKWVAGQPLSDSIVLIQKPFKRMTFLGSEEFSNRVELANLLDKYPRQGIEYLYQGERVIEAWARDANNIQLLTSIQAIVKRYDVDKQAGLYRVIHTLDPSRPFVTQAGVSCKNNYELGDALETEMDFYVSELTNPAAKLFIYTEAVAGEELADRFRAYFRDTSPVVALNRLIIEFQGGASRITIKGQRFNSIAELGDCADQEDITEEIYRQLLTDDSKLLCWLQNQGYLSEPQVPVQTGVDLFSILMLFPWLTIDDMVSAENLNDYLGDYVFDIISAGRSDLLEYYVSLQLSLNVNANSEDRLGYSPLSLAAELGNESLIDYLVDHGAEIEIPNASGVTPLITAIISQQTQSVKALLAKGANPNARWNGQTALSLCLLVDVDLTQQKYSAEVNLINAGLLLDAKANPNGEDDNGEIPLWQFIRSSADTPASIDLAKQLIKAGSSVRQTNKNDLDLLRRAVIEYRDRKDKGELLALIALMLENGADPNRLNQQGYWSALMIAAEAGNEPAVRLLLKHGASKTLADSANNIAYILAKNKGHTATAALLQPSALFPTVGKLAHIAYALLKVILIAFPIFSFDELARAINRWGLEAVPLGVFAYVSSLLISSYVLAVLSGSFTVFWRKFKATITTPKGILRYFLMMPILFAPLIALFYKLVGLIPSGKDILEIGASPWTFLQYLPGNVTVPLVYLAVLLACLAGIHFVTIAYVNLHKRIEAYRKA